MSVKTPRQLAEERLKEASQFAKLGERVAELILLKAVWWEACKEDYKSVASAERAWDRTSEGQEMTISKMKMKSKEHKMSALRTLIEVAKSEGFNTW